MILKYPNGDVYSGPIRDYLPHGNGILSQQDQSVLQGEFREGKFVPEEEKSSETQVESGKENEGVENVSED